MVDLMNAVEDLESWNDGVGLVLTGADNESGTFCSGGDLKTVHQIKTPEAGFIMSMLMSEATNRLANLPLVSVSFIKVKFKWLSFEIVSCKRSKSAGKCALS